MIERLIPNILVDNFWQFQHSLYLLRYPFVLRSLSKVEVNDRSQGFFAAFRRKGVQEIGNPFWVVARTIARVLIHLIQPVFFQLRLMLIQLTFYSTRWNFLAREMVKRDLIQDFAHIGSIDLVRASHGPPPSTRHLVSADCAGMHDVTEKTMLYTAREGQVSKQEVRRQT